MYFLSLFCLETSVRERDQHGLGFLRRGGNLRNCPRSVGAWRGIAVIRSTLEYSATVWDPYLKQDVDRQRGYNAKQPASSRDYRTRETGCVGHMLQELNLPPLQERGKQQRLTTLYKIVSEGPHPSHASRELPHASRQK